MNIKVKLAAIAKDEAAYISQWIHHHLYFGFDEIEIWINNTSDNSINILNEICNYTEGRVTYKVADILFNDCIKNGINFQIEAYTKIYAETLTSSDCTHILFLDLDELWTPRDFKSSIKELIRNNMNADAISFQWFFDTPEIKRPEFGRPFEKTNYLQKDRNVKTVIKISDRVKKLNIHNHIIQDGLYIMQNGHIFLDENPAQYSRSLVDENIFKTEKNELDDYFVFHQIYRSRIEYISSLLRGRNHVNDSRVLKINRFGYVLSPLSHPGIILTINTIELQDYEQSFFTFANQGQIKAHHEKSKYLNKNRYFQVINLLQKNPSYLIEYSQILQGLKLNDLLDYPLQGESMIYSIDNIIFSNDKSHIIIIGWVFDMLSNSKPEIIIKNALGIELSTVNEAIIRPDVVKVHPDATLDCGFIARLNINNFHQDDLNSQKKPFAIFFKSMLGLKNIDLETKFTDEFIYEFQNILSFPMAHSLPTKHEDYLRGESVYSDIAKTPHIFQLNIFFDVGANIGQSTQEIKLHFPNSTIFCFEPVASTYSALINNTKKYSNVHCTNLALGAYTGDAQIISEPLSVNNKIINRIEIENECIETIKIEKGDTFCEHNNIHRIDYLKIDTEGFDLDVLKGFSRMLKNKDILFIETESGMNSSNRKHVFFIELVNFLASFGYEVFGIYEQVREVSSISPLRRANIVFIRT